LSDACHCYHNSVHPSVCLSVTLAIMHLYSPTSVAQHMMHEIR